MTKAPENATVFISAADVRLRRCTPRVENIVGGPSMATQLTKPSDLIPSDLKKARVMAINDLVEEEVTLLIDETIRDMLCYLPPLQNRSWKLLRSRTDLELSRSLRNSKKPPRRYSKLPHQTYASTANPLKPKPK